MIRPRERAIERFDDLHATAAVRAWGRFVVAGAGAIIVIVLRGRRRHIEQGSTERELVGAVAVGEEAVVANAMKARW